MKFLNSMNLGMLMRAAKASAGRRYLRVRFLKKDPALPPPPPTPDASAESWCTKNGWHTARYLQMICLAKCIKFA